MLAFCAAVEACFSFVCRARLRAPEISFFVSAFRADFRSYRHDIRFLFLDSDDIISFFKLLGALYFYLAFNAVPAPRAPKILSLFYKNTSAFWAKFHVKSLSPVFLNVLRGLGQLILVMQKHLERGGRHFTRWFRSEAED